MAVEELTLEDLRGPEDTESKDEKGPGGLRGGGLGPEGSRYVPPEAPRRSTWKPTAIAIILLIGSGYGAFTIGYQITLEDRAEGNTYDLWGEVLDYDAAYDQREVPIAGVNVSVDGVEGTDVSDEDGKFLINGVPGGKFTIRFYKRSWSEAVNTRYTSILYTDVSKDRAATFLVRVEDLSPDRDRPVYEGTHGVMAEVMDWKTNQTVSLRVHASAFDEDLSTFSVQMGEPGEPLFDQGLYSNHFNYTFSVGGDQSSLTIKVLDDQGRDFAQTILAIPEHPLGPGGWETTDFPQVSTFVRGGPFTDGEDRTIAVHSNGANETRYRVDGGSWTDWTAMTDGHAELTWDPDEAGEHQIEVAVRNATGVEGTSDTVTITHIDTPPDLEPEATRGPAVTNEATFDPGSLNASFIRYRADFSGEPAQWSSWQAYMDEVLVTIDDESEGGMANVTFQAMDRAGNVETAKAQVTIKHQKEFYRNDHEAFYNNLMICLPIQAIGIVLAAFGAMMAFKRRRPTMVMLGAMGALLAGYGLIGAIIAAAALVLIMMSREEFEMPGPAPER
ncbi:MAG: hypothetical protein GWN18_08785 [Thermoplasmata archaeon]|nr:carboxypeptidase-like regulatory domain-containing protein [Thermoplasmata archaeon]NIS12135.1 carboxypeptidase-like regulatory domain-containing protein [Thermoplasmata archaeon]NIS21901.1 carboxypeptidase-like regulatory domain-containing protein [Thermoplasmata archaeon]NIT77266.1 carboxypeptidase-like regulatory domain-containing protein [Thermoplasmata archaeon]NIU50936.1 carboxypeptidase-like regulatory domain-containing protein [Thermoplasmata archaeon]